MAIKTKDITINDGGKEKRFRIKQMPHTVGEKWVLKLIMLMGASNVSGNLEKALSGLRFEDIEPLYDQLLPYIEIYTQNGETMPIIIDGHIEELSTLLKLRMEAFMFNIDFFSTGALSITPAKAQH